MTPNEAMNPDSELAPAVDMGVTELYLSERYPGTIVRVSESGKTFWYQEDTATRTDKNGMSESQTYEFKPDYSAQVKSARKHKNGRWVNAGGTTMALGYRSRYYDYSF